jgi:glyoxylase-like metal-dependent hydrolase (beta-lactamase superfamily II)
VSGSGGGDRAAGEQPVAEVAPGVFVATAETYTTTTTVIAGDDGPGGSVHCLLIDPAVSVADLAALARWLGMRGLRPAAGWSTHPHWDHLLWARAFGDVPRYATPRAAAVAARERDGLVAGVQDEAPGHDLALFGQVEALPGAEIEWPGPRAVVYPHDAHAPGHGAVFLPDAGVLIAGDMCSDIEVPLPDLDDPDPFGGYRAGLSTLAAIPGVSAVIPGHGHPGDVAEFHRRLAADLAYLDAVAAGRDYPDPRLTEDWLRAEHARALARARATHPGEEYGR